MAAAAPEIGPSSGMSVPAQRRPAVPVLRRRLVAVAVSPMELLRPESDLARLAEAAEEVDLLTACEDGPAGDAPPWVLGNADYLDAAGCLDRADDLDDLDSDDDTPGAGDLTAPADEVGEAIRGLSLPNLRVHRLMLRPPLGPGAERDLVAALSELVGFDPEPGVYCLAPAVAPGDPARAVVNRATQRIAQVYGLPVLRYRCLELSVVDDVE